jgi:hypothetical protein
MVRVISILLRVSWLPPLEGPRPAWMVEVKRPFLEKGLAPRA